MVEDKKDTLDVHQKKTKDSRNRSSNGQHPKITIENGTRSEESKKVPVSEVKPIKKETRKKDADVVEDKKDTLDVHQKKTKDPKRKTKESRSSKGQKHKTAKDPELKSKYDRKHSKDDKHKQHHKSKDESDGIKNKDAKTSSRTRDDVKTKDKRKKTRNDVEDALLNNLKSKDLNNIKETTSKLLESLKNDATQEVTKPEDFIKLDQINEGISQEPEDFIKLDQINEGISQEPATVQAQDLLTPSSSNQIQATKQTRMKEYHNEGISQEPSPNPIMQRYKLKIS
ncbi:hypothetical protein QE152_g5911 [Popillia japonica]|uniref:Uncharacterized protein n=1 Tax=Popillia japonica TaxID=7064 RepID=A0AAW1MKN5_POPJA